MLLVKKIIKKKNKGNFLPPMKIWIHNRSNPLKTLRNIIHGKNLKLYYLTSVSFADTVHCTSPIQVLYLQYIKQHSIFLLKLASGMLSCFAVLIPFCGVLFVRSREECQEWQRCKTDTSHGTCQPNKWETDWCTEVNIKEWWWHFIQPLTLGTTLLIKYW